MKTVWLLEAASHHHSDYVEAVFAEKPCAEDICLRFEIPYKAARKLVKTGLVYLSGVDIEEYTLSEREVL